MSKWSKKLAALAAVAGGIVLNGGCLSGFFDGVFQQGFVDNRFIDIVSDWLNEDIFG